MKINDNACNVLVAAIITVIIIIMIISDYFNYGNYVIDNVYLQLGPYKGRAL